jgi:hypothetical protein
LGAKLQNIFEKQVYLIQNNVIILVFCDIATIWFFLDLATGDKATKSEIKCSNVQNDFSKGQYDTKVQSGIPFSDKKFLLIIIYIIYYIII